MMEDQTTTTTHPAPTVPETLAARLREIPDEDLQLIGRTGPAFANSFDNGFDNAFDNAFDNS